MIVAGCRIEAANDVILEEKQSSAVRGVIFDGMQGGRLIRWMLASGEDLASGEISIHHAESKLRANIHLVGVLTSRADGTALLINPHPDHLFRRSPILATAVSGESVPFDILTPILFRVNLITNRLTIASGITTLQLVNRRGVKSQPYDINSAISDIQIAELLGEEYRSNYPKKIWYWPDP